MRKSGPWFKWLIDTFTCDFYPLFELIFNSPNTENMQKLLSSIKHFTSRRKEGISDSSMNKPRSRESICDNCLSMEANVEAHREISNPLTSQLQGVKQKLHSTHEYKNRQMAYEELSSKYSRLLGRAERDEDLHRPVCHPCTAKPSKSLVHFGYQELLEANEDESETKQSLSKSWHRVDTAPNLSEREKKWRDKFHDIMTSDGFRGTELMRNSSSSY